MNAKQKRSLAIFAGVGVVAATILLMGKKKAHAASAPAQLGDGSDEHPIDLDALADQPDETSPGWPQPQETPQPAVNVPANLPQIINTAMSAPGPLPQGLPQIPTAINLPTTLPQTEDDDEAPTPAHIPVPTLNVPPRPPASTAELPSPSPQDTVTMVQRLLAQETQPNWKKSDPVLQAWQKSRGLVDDGKFGPGTALRVADEIGTIPLIRFWPKGTYPEGHWINDYKAALVEKANASPSPRKEQLMASADRENGQGFARNVPAQKNVIKLEVS